MPLTLRWKQNRLLTGLTKDKKNQKLLAIWSADCAEHVLPLFEKKHPKDKRPREAIKAARAWARDEIRCGEARRAALAAHAAARDADDDESRAAARASGHAAAVAHVITHASGAPEYACKARSFLPRPKRGMDPSEKERKWQAAKLRKILRGHIRP